MVMRKRNAATQQRITGTAPRIAPVANTPRVAPTAPKKSHLPPGVRAGVTGPNGTGFAPTNPALPSVPVPPAVTPPRGPKKSHLPPGERAEVTGPGGTGFGATNPGLADPGSKPDVFVPPDQYPGNQPAPVAPPAPTAPAPIDYDALIAADPQYQLLLAQLEAAMKNAESDAGAEEGNIRAQTERRLQQLRELSPQALEASNNDFAGRGLGFSGGFLEDQGRIRRDFTNQENDYVTDRDTAVAEIGRQLGKARGDYNRSKNEAYVNTGERLRGKAPAHAGPPPGISPITSPGAPPAPTVPFPGAVERRLSAPGTAPVGGGGGTAGPGAVIQSPALGGVFNRKRRIY